MAGINGRNQLNGRCADRPNCNADITSQGILKQLDVNKAGIRKSSSAGEEAKQATQCVIFPFFVN
jgi:hypothetical protein